MAITITLNYETFDYSLYSITIDHTCLIVTTVTRSYIIADTWAENMVASNGLLYSNRQLIIGISIQFVPAYGHHAVATLQLSTGSRCLIFQICHSHTPYAPIFLRRLLLDSRVTFVTLDNNVDLDLRLRLIPQCLSFRYMPVNLRLHVGGWNGESMENYSVLRIARDTLAILVDETDRGWRFSNNWEVDRLSTGQIAHASVGASVAFWIGRNLPVWRFRD